jgi:hypothetical protein
LIGNAGYPIAMSGIAMKVYGWPVPEDIEYYSIMYLAFIQAVTVNIHLHGKSIINDMVSTNRDLFEH